MKTLILALLIHFNFCILNAQSDIVIPPGTIKIKDSLFIDKSPVTNMMFSEYLLMRARVEHQGYSTFSEFAKDATERNEPIKNEAQLYPSFSLIDFYSNQEDLKYRPYVMDSKYRHHPILNVTKQQASDFCKWRTEMVIYLWNTEKYASNILSDKISYRLATKNELTHAYTFFSNSNSVLVFEKSIFKIKQQKETSEFLMFPITEMTLSDQLFNDHSNYKFMGFRCVCEIK